MVRLALFLVLPLAAQAPPHPDTLQQKALTLAASRDYSRLARLITDPAFLSNLDSPATGKTRRLETILKALEANAGPDTASLCHTLAASNVFLSDPDRRLFLLNILAAVRPMSKQTVALFQESNALGYFPSNAILLASNASPLAMELFETMMVSNAITVENRIDLLHFALIPRRTSLPILRSAANIAARATDPRLAHGALKSIFDYQPRWFRPSNAADRPPPWESASRESLAAALQLARAAQRRRDLPPALRREVDAAVRKLSAL